MTRTLAKALHFAESLAWIDLAIGSTFDTPFETNCHCLTLPDIDGNFEALDSDGVICIFHTVMVVTVHKENA